MLRSGEDSRAMDSAAWEELQKALAELREISKPGSLKLDPKQYLERVERRIVLLDVINKLLSLWENDSAQITRVHVYRTETVWSFSLWREGSCIKAGKLGISDAASEADAVEAARRLVP